MYSRRNVYEEVIEWLDTHNGEMPREVIERDGKKLKVVEMTPEEREERELAIRWSRTFEYKALRECQGISLEELPTKYERYREKIATLRRYEQMRKDNELKRKMKKSVRRQVGNNTDTRQEIAEVAISLDSTIKESEVLDGK